MKTVQLNAEIPLRAKTVVKDVSRLTGIRIEELVLDGIKLLAGQADEETLTRARLFKETCKRRHLQVCN